MLLSSGRGLIGGTPAGFFAKPRRPAIGGSFVFTAVSGVSCSALSEKGRIGAKHFFQKAEDWGLIAENPNRRIKLQKENNRRLRFLSLEECGNLLASCSSLMLRQIVEMALNTGMRKSELLLLEWEHVNLRQGFLEILDQKNGEYDTIPLNKRSAEILRSIPRRLDSKYVFPGKIPGKPFADLKRRFGNTVKSAGLKDVTFHTLRHTAASYLVMAGVDLATVREILRHKSFSMTLRYSHLSAGHK